MGHPQSWQRPTLSVRGRNGGYREGATFREYSFAFADESIGQQQFTAFQGTLMSRKTFSLALRFIAPLLLAAPALYGQTAPTPLWATVAPESVTTSVTLPAGTTYRFGDYTNNKWSAPVTAHADTTISPISMAGPNPFPFGDPDYGVAKELDVLETTAQQSISVTNLATSTAVAQVVPPLVPPATVPVTPGTAYTLTFSNFTIAPGTTQNALMLAFVNQPASQASRTWEGTQMNLTIDGVTLVCTYGQTYTDGVFSLNCTVPTTPPGSTPGA